MASQPARPATLRHPSSSGSLSLGPHPGVPFYVHPAIDPDGWRNVPEAVGPDGFVVANVHNGPGRAGDPYYGPVLGGLTHLGYVHLGYGRRPVERILADTRRWLAWYDSAGIMLDQVPQAASAWVRLVVERVRAAGARTVVGNPGVVASPAVLAAFDVVCVVEDTAERYVGAAASSRALAEAASEHRTWHLVHSCTPGLRDAVRERALATGAAYLHVTEAVMPHPWGAQAGWWPRAGT